MSPSREVRHLPVMPGEVLRLLDPQPGETWVDCTVGGGGHARLIAEKIGPSGRLIGLDQDPTMLELARTNLAGLPFELVHANFDQLPEVLGNRGIDTVDGVLADLGFASDQVEQPGRGLSFRAEGPLDMRLDSTAGTTAAEAGEHDERGRTGRPLLRIRRGAAEPCVARRIVERRKEKPFATTSDLADLVRSCVRKSGGIDPATRVFQALRIAVNDELGGSRSTPGRAAEHGEAQGAGRHHQLPLPRGSTREARLPRPCRVGALDEETARGE